MQAFFVRLIIHQIGSSNVRGVCACACVQNSVQQTRTCDVRRILDLSIECCRVAEASAVQYLFQQEDQISPTEFNNACIRHHCMTILLNHVTHW
jgi:hypothetical protein